MEKMPIEEHIRNFHSQWDNFPFSVMLIRKDRTIVAVNAAAQGVGVIEGVRCCDLGTKESHNVCMANCALKEQKAQRLTGYFDDYKMVLDTYWIPVAGEEDLYIHFSIDITEYAAPRMFPVETQP